MPSQVNDEVKVVLHVLTITQHVIKIVVLLIKTKSLIRAYIFRI